MPNVLRMSTRMHPYVQPHPRSRMLPAQEKPAGSEIKRLVSRLKRLITTAIFAANSAQERGEHFRMVDLRLAATYSAKKLRDIIDGKTDKSFEMLNLQDAIRVLEDVLYKGTTRGNRS
jgi:hypothetical protein